MKHPRLMKTFFAILLNLISCYCILAQNTIPFAASLKEANVTLTTMQNGQHESLIVGNGDLYGIVWEKENGLFMRITKNDIWDARIDASQDGELPRVDIVNNVISGPKGAPPSYKKPYPQPRCAAALHLGPISASEKVSAHLDIEKASVSVTSTNRQNTTIRILHDRNVLLINSQDAVTLEAIKAETLPDATVGTSDGISWLLMKMPGDIDYKGMDYALAVATKGDLKAVSLVTSFDIKTGDVLEHGSVGIFNCPFDIAYVHYTFDALIQAAAEMRADKDLVVQCHEYKALLGSYPTAMNGSGEPIVVDWEGCQYKQIEVHNITVPASPVFPADQVTWFSPEPEKELFRRTIMDTRFNGNNSHVMFNIAKARLSMPEAVVDAKAWFISRELPNGLFVWQGHAHGTFMGEMIGVAGLVNEFLLQSVQNKIRLFPCWPGDKDAKFSQLRAQGGFIVSAEFVDGRVASTIIESTVGKQLQLLSPWKTIYVNGKETAIGPDGLVTLNTMPGQVLLFSETQ